MSKKSTVLMFGWEWPPYNSGGLGVACFGLSRALARRGASVLFVLPFELPINASWAKFIFASTALPDKRLLQYAAYNSVSGFSLRGKRIEVAGSTLLDEVLAYAKRAGEIAANESFDIIHAHDWLSFLAGVEAKRISGKPLVVHMHATEFDRTGGGSVHRAVYEIERFGMEEADKVAAVSGYTKNIIERHYGIDPRKIEVLHNGVDIEDCETSHEITERIARLKESGTRIVLFVGRLTLQKGPDYFIRAARKVAQHRQNTVFVIAGSGDMERKLIEEVAWLGLSDKIIFCGFIRGRELWSLIKSADTVVMPSVSEPFGIVALEALIHDTPVVISRQSGVIETTTHMLKSDFWDIDDMADKIIAALDHDVLKNHLVEHGKRDALQTTWAKTAEKCLAMYNQILSFGV
jgi:glycosyltransferase involved in cell wall biosynthesis